MPEERPLQWIALFARSVTEVSVDEASGLDIAFLDSASSNQKNAWFAEVQMGEQETLRFKVDTGAER